MYKIFQRSFSRTVLLAIRRTTEGVCRILGTMASVAGWLRCSIIDQTRTKSASSEISWKKTLFKEEFPMKVPRLDTGCLSCRSILQAAGGMICTNSIQSSHPSFQVPDPSCQPPSSFSVYLISSWILSSFSPSTIIISSSISPSDRSLAFHHDAPAHALLIPGRKRC